MEETKGVPGTCCRRRVEAAAHSQRNVIMFASSSASHAIDAISQYPLHTHPTHPLQPTHKHKPKAAGIISSLESGKPMKCSVTVLFSGDILKDACHHLRGTQR